MPWPSMSRCTASTVPRAEDTGAGGFNRSLVCWVMRAGPCSSPPSPREGPLATGVAGQSAPRARRNPWWRPAPQRQIGRRPDCVQPKPRSPGEGTLSASTRCCLQHASQPASQRKNSTWTSTRLLLRTRSAPLPCARGSDKSPDTESSDASAAPAPRLPAMEGGHGSVACGRTTPAGEPPAALTRCGRAVAAPPCTDTRWLAATTRRSRPQACGRGSPGTAPLPRRHPRLTPPPRKFPPPQLRLPSSLGSRLPRRRNPPRGGRARPPARITSASELHRLRASSPPRSSNPTTWAIFRLRPPRRARRTLGPGIRRHSGRRHRLRRPRSSPSREAGPPP